MNDKTIDNLINEIAHETPNFSEDQNQKNAPSKQETRGRKNRGATKEHYEELKESYREFRRVPQNDSFNNDIVERVSGEIIEPDDVETFKELYRLTCYSVLEDFQKENEELCKKGAYMWYKRVLIKIKANVPKITADDIEKAWAVWDVLKEFLEYIGLYITYETFENVTSIYKYQLEDRQKLSARYGEFLKKINIERDSALLNELQYNPYNQTNKMFIAKVHGIIEKTEPKTIEVNHHIENFESISAYRLTEKE